MKKYFLSMIAVILAFTFSAFTPEKKAKTETTQDPLYWYFIATGNKIGSPVIDDLDQRTKDEVFETVDCLDASGSDCARGYESQQELNDDAPPSVGTDDHIMRF